MQIVDNMESNKNLVLTGNTAASYSTGISRIGKYGHLPVGSSGSRYPGYGSTLEGSDEPVLGPSSGLYNATSEGHRSNINESSLPNASFREPNSQL